MIKHELLSDDYAVLILFATPLIKQHIPVIPTANDSLVLFIPHYDHISMPF